jgi:hypothetical protein
MIRSLGSVAVFTSKFAYGAKEGRSSLLMLRRRMNIPR